jgi:hypothetical protein
MYFFIKIIATLESLWSIYNNFYFIQFFEYFIERVQLLCQLLTTPQVLLVYLLDKCWYEIMTLKAHSKETYQQHMCYRGVRRRVELQIRIPRNIWILSCEEPTQLTYRTSMVFNSDNRSNRNNERSTIDFSQQKQ